ncbi:MAG: RDD family protein [Actinobacteria bacterium]|nr:RDD family protein [Actinomycetota bacterium]
MENGSTEGAATAAGTSLNGAHLNGAGGHVEERPLSARLLGVGVRGARGIGRATGIDRTMQLAAEEAIVGAIESEAVERAMARVLQGPVVEEAVQGALESDAVKRAILEALDSELVDEVWRRLLASEEAQQLIERVAGAPELRAAISAQGAGLLDDLGRTIARLARRFDDQLERIVRRLLFRPSRTEPVRDAGAVSRGLGFAIDFAFINLGFTAIAALVTLVDNVFGGSSTGGSRFAIAAGSLTWMLLSGTYFVAFWSLAGQTPGMRFLGVRLAGGRLPLDPAIRRVFGIGISIVCLGLPFLGILFRESRRGFADKIAGTEVVYDERRPAPAPWSIDPDEVGPEAVQPEAVATAPPSEAGS